MDWAGLPPDLVHILSTKLLSTKLNEICDIIYFRAVCKNWRSFSTPNISPKKVPCIIKPCYSESDSKCCLLSSTYELELPEFARESHRGYLSDGYMIAFSTSQSSPPFIFNPLTGKVTFLPPLAMSHCYPIHIGNKIMVMGYSNGLRFLALHTLGDLGWKIEFGPYYNHGNIYYDNNCYVQQYNGNVDAINSTNGKLMFQVRDPESSIESELGTFRRWGGNYLVALDNEIIHVYQSEDKHILIDECSFVIHKFEVLENRRFNWLRVHDIGDNILFLDSEHVFCVKASDFDGYNANNVYFFKFNFHSNWRCLLCRYDIAKKQTELVQNLPFEYGSDAKVEPRCKWFMPTVK